ncbi:hypothetical protein [Novosphingobium sp.]|uniref:hypothetical protein n=1 Tax=Novosphingobium sp. TaxID=1874826 RepID=UPI00286E44CC|nr:hypothetical protein [Novosphingobium sp.]
MSRNLDRLYRGERWWAAELVLRSLGIVLLAGSYRLGLIAHRMVTAPRLHQATMGELAVGLAIVACLTSGLALTMFGPKLFELVPIPKSNRLYWKS